MPTYTSSKAFAAAGYGTTISIGGVTGAGGTETFTSIGEVNSADLSTPTRKTVSVTNFQSPSFSEEFLGTQIDYGTVTLSVNRIPNDPGQEALLAALGTPYKYDFKLQLPVNTAAGQATTGDLYTFSAVIMDGGGMKIDTESALQLKFTLKISGVLNLTIGS